MIYLQKQMSSRVQEAFVITIPSPPSIQAPARCFLQNSRDATARKYPATIRKFRRVAPIICAEKRSNAESSDATRNTTATTQAAGGRASLSAEFLAVSGAVASAIGVIATVPLTAGFVSHPLLLSQTTKKICTILSSFSYGLLLSRFDLRKAKYLKLTIAFSLLMRFVCMPILSHAVATAGYAIVKLTSTRTAAAAAVAAVNAPETVKATAASLSLPAGVLSSLFLLSATPAGFSPSAAMLSIHIHTTLLAILISLTLILFPIIPCMSHAVSVWAHRSAFLNIGAILPKVAPPPNFQNLVLVTSFPFLCGMALSEVLPRRIAAICGFLSLPVSWLCSLFLLSSAISNVVSGSVTGLAGSIGLCGGVAVMMVLLARALGSGLSLDVRAKRTLTLYLCTQGTVVGAGIAPLEFAAAPHIASALVGMLFAAIMGKIWSHVIVKTSTDVIL